MAQGLFGRHQAKLRKLAALSWADRWLLVEIFGLLGLARLALRVVPFRRLARALGTLHVETPTEVPPEQLAQARRVGQAIARVHRYTPWTSNCFPQALAARAWLARRHIPTTLYLGVALNKTDPATSTTMEAHAWLRCGSLIVTGGRGSERFTVTACFGS
ncbi:lasso peptide biosynthesis B2 protein [Candidatus Chloroploca sp. Khr17]|uniref:lasso peptide biosynthesis B2 protein n=1 Tax=Candidatus Chloroploca sp. Khr17 TaxID=2496869 RepID=UPI0013EBA7CE|nr:lasso peptide biosynthesis B2 protein [Candidatus Chloroploca sp. Khr17]